MQRRRTADAEAISAAVSMDTAEPETPTAATAARKDPANLLPPLLPLLPPLLPEAAEAFHPLLPATFSIRSSLLRPAARARAFTATHNSLTQQRPSLNSALHPPLT
eukprot:TRINITY_DN82_c0_g3_i1.p2 TRINITY_DN82_c0_g3~~TRINITY_DN82_c0_g3_i1.p2  ORF type:complete len:106 (+),score=3.79 TRINITY_DN82_c0_g3_i1:101-418(+)